MRFLLTVSDRGLISLPIKLRRLLGLKAADQLIAESTGEGILLRPCVTLPIEIYSESHINEFDQGESDLQNVLGKLDLE